MKTSIAEASELVYCMAFGLTSVWRERLGPPRMAYNMAQALTVHESRWEFDPTFAARSFVPVLSNCKDRISLTSEQMQ